MALDCGGVYVPSQAASCRSPPRSPWQVLLVYVGASWVVLEAADVMVARLALPEWVYGAAIVLLLVGLPIVLATAFVQEGVTPSRPEPHDSPGSHSRFGISLTFRGG